MPNWFYFSLNVSGKKEDVQAFVENVKGKEGTNYEGREFDFNHFIPQPEGLYDEKSEDNIFPNWYNWNIENWGTKWNASVDDAYLVSDKEGFPYEYHYDMRTAWADPRPVIFKMIEMYPDLDIDISGEEESNAYGIYISSSEDVFLEEEPTLIDEMNDKEVFWEDSSGLWRYVEDNEIVEDQDDFWPINKYSWY